MSDDYATLARIEDHLRRQADASERIADALERAHAAYMDIEASNQPAKPCDDRTCTDRDHWAPTGRINHGSTPTTCIHGQDHPDSLTCEYRCAASTPGHWCTRREHADDRHVWAMSDEEYDRRREEAGVPREVFDDVRAWADGREAAQRRLTAGCGDRGGECGQMDGSVAARPNGNDSMAFHSFREAYDWIAEPDPLADIMTAIETGCDMVTASLGLASNPQKTAEAMRAAVALLRETVMRYTGPAVTVDARSLETGEPVPVSVTVRKVADPLDESDHRPRHFPMGDHLRRLGCGRWHSLARACDLAHYSQQCTLEDWDRHYGPLTFCDCDDATIEAENGATD